MKKIVLGLTILLIILWVLLFIVFEIDRAACQPLLSAPCLYKGWQDFEDFILLDWVERWQTLIAGAIAIFAALIGGYFINKQVTQAERAERENLKRKHFAARSVSPLSLSAMTEYVVATGSALKIVYEQAVGGAIPRTAKLPEIPDIPQDILHAFQEMIETSDQTIANAFADILADAQIHQSRLLSLVSEQKKSSLLKLNIQQYILDAASIYAQTSALFEYARRQVERAPEPVTWDKVRTGLHLMGIWQEDFNDIFDTIARREQRGLSPRGLAND